MNKVLTLMPQSQSRPITVAYEESNMLTSHKYAPNPNCLWIEGRARAQGLSCDSCHIGKFTASRCRC